MRADAGDFEEMEEGGALSIERALFAVRRRLKLVIALPIVAFAITAGAVSFLSDRYDAVALIQIDPRQKSITKIEAVLPDLTADRPTIESEVEIIRSRPIALQVIDKLDLRHDPELNGPGLLDRARQNVGSYLGMAEAAPVETTRRTTSPA
ncbi:MAG: Wzz/FepE/Etk N-terminal domain-containing protein, partial [Myxococcota bacterium]